MSVEADIFAALSGAAGVTAMVAQRIYPDVLPDKTTYPAVVFEVQSIPIPSVSGVNLGDEVTVTVASWGKSRTEANAVRDAAEAALRAAGFEPSNKTSGFDPETSLFAGILTVEAIEQP